MLNVPDKVIKQSVQTSTLNSQLPLTGVGDSGWWGFIEHPEIISPWGTRQRDIELRRYSYAVHNSLVQGAFASFIKKICAVPWEVKGGRNHARYYQDMLQNAEFGQGWSTFLSRLLWDYLTQDFGAVIEIIGLGNPDKAIRGRVSGIAQMDSLSCVTTKSTEFPIIYWNEEDFKMHRIHQTRVYRLVDSPSPKRMAYGNGLCALSRYISESNVDILLGKYDNELLNDLPMPGIMAVKGMSPQEWKDAQARYELARNQDGQQRFRNTMVVNSVDPSRDVGITVTPFSTQPTNFDPENFVRVHVNKLALAMGVDPQDIWPLTGSAIGTGTQSEMLSRKAQGKLFGHVLSEITRFINWYVLPDGVEFQFKFKDTDADKENAERAQVWADVVNSLTMLNDEQKLHLLANNVEEFATVLLDEAGELITLPDDDPKADEVTGDDLNPLATAEETEAPEGDPDADEKPDPKLFGQRGRTQPGATDGALREPSGIRTDLGGRRNPDQSQASGLKDYSDTKDTFLGDVATIIGDAATGVISKPAFAIRMRAALAKYGKLAYLDGLGEGGVTEMDDTDSSNYADLLAEASQYVSNARASITDFSGDADARATLWQKSIDPFYYAGIESADKNGNYTFDGDDGEESCPQCRELKGVTHRMAWWVKNKKRPVIDAESFDCGGWKCQHRLVKKVA